MKNRKEKDRLRKLKRQVKRSGNKKVRSAAKKDLLTNPEDAHLTQVDYGGSTSRDLNGNDHDATRLEGDDALRTKREYRKKAIKPDGPPEPDEDDKGDENDLA